VSELAIPFSDFPGTDMILAKLQTGIADSEMGFMNSLIGTLNSEKGIERIPKGIWRIRERNSENLEANPQKKVRISYGALRFAPKRNI
jgi:hypothetical protein